MPRVIIPIIIFATALALSIFTGLRLGHRAGVENASRHPASQPPAFSAPASSASGADRTPARASSRSRDEMTAWLEERKARILQARQPSGPALADEFAALTLEEAMLALEQVRTWPSDLTRLGLLNFLLTRLAREDPAAAAAWLKTNSDKTNPAFNAILMGIVYKQWAESDPRTAAPQFAAALHDVTDGFAQSKASNSVFMIAEKLAQADLPAAFRLVQELPEWTRRQAVTAVAKQVHGAGRESFLNAIRTMPPGADATTWQHAAATALAPVDATAAGQWIDSLHLSADESGAAARAVFQDWKSHDPRAATAWAMTRLPAAEHGALVTSTVQSWAQSEPNDCGRWLNELGENPSWDPAFAAFAGEVKRKDPESARAWAARISDAALRERTLSGITE